MQYLPEEIEIAVIPGLKPGEIYISHVGDGEYSFNVFGSAHFDLIKYLNLLAESEECELKDLVFYQYLTNNRDYFIGKKVPVSDYMKSHYKLYSEFTYITLACLTIEEIDPEKLNRGYY